MAISRRFRRVLHILLDIFLAVVLPALAYTVYRFASVIKEWILRGWAWLERRIMLSGTAIETDQNGIEMPGMLTNHDHAIDIVEISTDSVDGNEELRPLFPLCSSTEPNDDDFVEARKSELKNQGDDAFKKQDYINASASYTQAMRVDRDDVELFSNRSLCWLYTGDGHRALEDALCCKILRPKWAKGHFLEGQAWMLLKDYEKACDILTEGLELDPLNDELYKLYWESMELQNGGTEASY